MTSKSRQVVLTVLVLCFVARTASSQTGPVVWIAPSSLHRVTQTEATGTTTQATLASARNGHSPFQIVVTAPASGLTGVNLSISDLIGPGAISHTSFTLYREYYVKVTTGSPNWGGSNQPLGPGWYADGLIPFNDPVTGSPLSGASINAVPATVSASQNQPFWIDLLVPASAAAGTYNGTYTVTSNQGSFTGQISLTVWNFTLPATPALKSAFLFSSQGTLTNQEQLLQHRLSPSSITASTGSMLMSSYGLGATDAGPYSGAYAGNCVMSAAPSVATFQAEVAAQASGLYLYDYSADEIDSCTNLYTTVQQWAYNMHQAGMNNLITVTPNPNLYSDGSTTGRSAVDTWVMLPMMYNSAPANVAYVQQKGDSTWSYNTLVQDAYSPKWEIDFDPINFRIQPGFISQSLGLNGLLYWRIDDWIQDPWTNVNNTGTFSSNNYPGEGQLFYPGADVGASSVVPSMRLKWLRDGVEDYDYVQILKNLGNATLATQIANSVGPDWTNWTHSDSTIDSARLQLGQAINQLVGGSGGTAPSAPANPSPATGSTGIALAPTLSWSAASGATAYDLYFGTSTPALVASNLTTTSYSPGTLLASTNYSWQVVAKNSSGSTSSATWSFTTINVTPAPSAPSNPSPANGSTNVATATGLSWTASTNATSYSVYLNGTLLGQTTGTTYNPGALSAGTAYTWRVVAAGPGGSTSSATWSFTTMSNVTPAPSAPSNPSPANGATNVSTTTALSWTASSNATSYSVYLNGALLGQTTGTSYTAAGLSTGANYSWKVVATGPGGSTSSATWSFTTISSVTPPPSAPANPSPANGATGVSVTTTLKWSASTNTTSYSVYLNGTLVKQTTGTSYATPTLASDTTYSWSVVATGPGGSTSSPPWTFKTRNKR